MRRRLGHCRAHQLGAVFKFTPDTFAVNRRGVPIPSKALDPDLRDIAAEAAITFKQSRFDARPRRRQSRSKAAGA